MLQSSFEDTVERGLQNAPEPAQTALANHLAESIVGCHGPECLRVELAYRIEIILHAYTVASVVLSYFAALGLTAIVFVRLGGRDSVDYILPFVLFIFLMALGSDYNILVMRRIREEAGRQPLRQAVQTALARTGGTGRARQQG